MAKGFSVISPNAKTTEPKPRVDAKPMAYDRAMQAALDRARELAPQRASFQGPA